MSEKNTVNANSGISPAFLLFIVFLVLKLTGIIAWSWWWVTAPLWGIFAIFAALFLFAFLWVVVSALFTRR